MIALRDNLEIKVGCPCPFAYLFLDRQQGEHRCGELGRDEHVVPPLDSEQFRCERRHPKVAGRQPPMGADHLGDLGGIQWAQEVYDGDQHPGWWRRFRPVLPQGSAPLQAATFAAALARDGDLTAELAECAIAAEADADEVARFKAEIAHVLQAPGT